MARYCVIIPAAGKAERFGGDEKKTFAKLDGRPVFLRTIEHFMSRQDVCQKILAVAPEDLATVKSSYGANLGFMGVQLVEGGEYRCDSVAAALRVVSDESEYVAIHDAARPCITPDRIDKVFEEAVKSGAAILAMPLVGTIKRVSELNVVEETVSRAGLFEAQTPQVFRKDILVQAYQRLDPSRRVEMTDDAQVVEAVGHAVSVVAGDATNIKVTTKSDLTLASAIMKARPGRPVSRMGAFEEAQW